MTESQYQARMVAWDDVLTALDSIETDPMCLEYAEEMKQRKILFSQLEKQMFRWMGKVKISMASYTPTFTGFGTVSNINFWWSRVGNMCKVVGTVTVGTTTGTEARITLPNSITSDTSIITTLSACGIWGNGTDQVAGFCLIESGTAYITIGAAAFGVLAPLVKRNGSTITSSISVSFKFEVPISGWN